ARVDGRLAQLGDDLRLDRQMRHDIDVVVDRLTVQAKLRPRLAEAVDLALRMGRGTLVVAVEESGTTRDIVLSVDYACTPCGISFEPPSPQLFSFNSPQGMCRSCDGLGQQFSFDPELLVPDPSKSLKQGAIELIGAWKEIGRWRRHLLQGVADTLEREQAPPAGTMLETPPSD